MRPLRYAAAGLYAVSFIPLRYIKGCRSHPCPDVGRFNYLLQIRCHAETVRQLIFYTFAPQ